jgi:hypothetical protein
VIHYVAEILKKYEDVVEARREALGKRRCSA